jgi:hypothetical protein
VGGLALVAVEPPLNGVDRAVADERSTARECGLGYVDSNRLGELSSMEHRLQRAMLLYATHQLQLPLQPPHQLPLQLPVAQKHY